MGRLFIAGHFFRGIKLPDPAFQGLDPSKQPGNVLLLPEHFIMKLLDRIVLLGDHAFELIHALFHDGTLTDLRRIRNRFIRFYVDASGGLE